MNDYIVAQDTSDNRYWYLNAEKLDCSIQEEFDQLMRLKAFW